MRKNFHEVWVIRVVCSESRSAKLEGYNFASLGGPTTVYALDLHRDKGPPRLPAFPPGTERQHTSTQMKRMTVFSSQQQ